MDTTHSVNYRPARQAWRCNYCGALVPVEELEALVTDLRHEGEGCTVAEAFEGIVGPCERG